MGGFPVPKPPATAATTQAGIASLPHPATTSSTGAAIACTTCHASGAGGKGAKGYDHVSPLIASNCGACHEAGSNLVATAWNGATSAASGAGDTRPFTLASIVASRGAGNTCTVTAAKHFYPVDCKECHPAPAGIATAAIGAAYTSAWTFAHTNSKMTNPSTCNLCHTTGCPK